MAKLIVDKKKCIGCGTCVALAPKVFALTNDNKAEVISQTNSQESIKQAIEACPVQAISYQK